jgi:quercetin dioxygenase-like cupin family protein
MLSAALDFTTGLHCHPCPVVGLIVEGAATIEIEGEVPRELPAGSAFHEPAGKRILRFDNASNEQPMTFVAFYLLRAGQPLIEVL